MNPPSRRAVLAIIVLITLIALLLPARMAPAAQARENVTLPYRMPQTDASGNLWRIYPNGAVRQQGGMPIYGEVATPQVNGAQPNMNNNQARVEASGELVMENMAIGGCTLSRRVLAGGEGGYLRIVDVFKNTQAREVTLNLTYRSTMNFGIGSEQAMADPKKKGALASIAQDGQGREVLEMYGGTGAKVLPTSVAQQNGWMMATMTLAIPAGRQLAVMHFHGASREAGAGAKFVNEMKAGKLTGDLSGAIRRLIVNFAGGQGLMFDEPELLRGDVFDCIELRSGDQVRGTLKDASYKLKTSYGVIELPAAKIAGIVNAGESRQLVVTLDGEIYGGRLESQAVGIRLSSGTDTQVPMGQMARVGYRRQAGEVDPAAVDRPMLFLRSGERMAIALPEADIPLASRLGLLKLSPKSIAAVSFQDDQCTLHTVTLTDGSRLSGLVTADAIEVGVNAASGRIIRFPISTISQIQLTSKIDEVDDTTATLQLTNEDVLAAALSGQLKLQTSFDTLLIDAAQIKRLSPAQGAFAGTEMHVTLWDETTIGGVLLSGVLECQLRGGLPLRVPVPLLAAYAQPSPQPSPAIVERIKRMVADLNSDDSKQRDLAQEELRSMGAGIAGVLKQLRPDQTPEGQQRIDAVLNALKPPPPAEVPDDNQRRMFRGMFRG